MVEKKKIVISANLFLNTPLKIISVAAKGILWFSRTTTGTTKLSDPTRML